MIRLVQHPPYSPSLEISRMVRTAVNGETRAISNGPKAAVEAADQVPPGTRLKRRIIEPTITWLHPFLVACSEVLVFTVLSSFRVS